MNIIMLGAPGAGKGTISSKLVEKYGLVHISTGEIFRENMKKNTELGMKAKAFIERGALVPDNITLDMMMDRLSKDDCKVGFILDGFPRNISQAEGLKVALTKNNLTIDLCILVDASDEDIIDRLEGRRVCEKCGDTYHMKTLKPKVSGTCDKCGSNLIQRKDDTKEVVLDRLKTYHEQTEPLVDYYKNMGILKTIDGFEPLENSLMKIDEMMK